MGIVKIDDIRAVFQDEKYLCPDCFDLDDENLKEEDILTETDIENMDDVIFCDNDGERI